MCWWSPSYPCHHDPPLPLNSSGWLHLFAPSFNFKSGPYTPKHTPKTQYFYYTNHFNTFQKLFADSRDILALDMIKRVTFQWFSSICKPRWTVIWLLGWFHSYSPAVDMQDTHTRTHKTSTLLSRLYQSIGVPTLSHPQKMPIVKTPIYLSLFFLSLPLFLFFSFSPFSFPIAFYHRCLYSLIFSLLLPRLISLLAISSSPLPCSPIQSV